MTPHSSGKRKHDIGDHDAVLKEHKFPSPGDSAGPSRVRRKQQEEEEKKKRRDLRPAVAVLCGPPGSGKSTFALEVVEKSSGGGGGGGGGGGSGSGRQWSRVCQDVINSGARGTRQQCVKAMITHLSEGKSVLVDRCHVTPDQRRDFLEAARTCPGGVASVYAVVFRNPLPLLIERIKNRVGHEGGLDGWTGEKVTARMYSTMQKCGLPAITEGFDEICVINSDSSRTHALNKLLLLEERATVPVRQKVEKEEKRGNVFQMMMNAAKANVSRAEKIRKLDDNDDEKQLVFSESDTRKPFLNTLHRIARNPESFREQHPELILNGQESCLMIRDKYPKSKYHFLVVARDANLLEPKRLTPQHVDLLKEMKHLAMKGIASWCGEVQTETVFEFGFHSVPSMPQLHMHVLSSDFDSPCMKTKKHFNSFNTEYFMKYDDVLSELERGKSLDYSIGEMKELLKIDAGWKEHKAKRNNV